MFQTACALHFSMDRLLKSVLGLAGRHLKNACRPQPVIISLVVHSALPGCQNAVRLLLKSLFQQAGTLRGI